MAEYEKKYKTPTGEIITETIARQDYGDSFDYLIENGSLEEVVEGIDEVKKNPDDETDLESKELSIQPELNQNDLEVLQKDFVFPEPTQEPQQTNVVNQIPEVLAEEEVVVTPEETIMQREFLEGKGVDVDAMLREKKFGNKQTSGSEAEDIASEYNMFLTTNASQNITSDLSSSNLKPLERIVEDDQEIRPATVNKFILKQLNIDEDDYAAWEQNTQREESTFYKGVKKIVPLITGVAGALSVTEDQETYQKEKKDTEKLLSYKMEVMENLKQDIYTIDSRLQLAKSPEDKLQLLNIKTQLEAKLLEETNLLNKMGTLFPTYKKLTSDLDLKRRTAVYEAGQSGTPQEVLNTVIETAKTIPTTITNFVLGTAASVTALLDQGLTSVGADKKGVLAGVTEGLLSATEAVEKKIGPVSRSSIQEGKRITVGGKEYFVNEEGEVLDFKTFVNMQGIISEDQIKLIKERDKNIKYTEYESDPGAGLQSLSQTVVNLFALIRGGQGFSKALGVSPAVGMGVASYASTMAQSVEDMRADLVASGETEDEALNKAAIAGNAIATLDAVFSSLAGSNTKVLGSLTGFKTAVLNAVKTDGKNFSSQQLKSKIKELGKENFKEVFIEELPVLFSEKGINAIVNYATNKNVRSSKIKATDIIETVVLTIGATSGLGSRGLLKGNKRSDALKFVAQNDSDIKGTVEGLVNNNDITAEEGKSVYDEVYSMQVAANRTNGTIVNSDNMLEASDLLNQRQRLMEQKEGLEGPLKEDIDKQIADIDEQINAVKEKDNAQSREEVKGETVIEGDNQSAEFSKTTIVFRDRETLTNKTGVESEAGDRFVEKTVNDGIEKGQTTQEIIDRITPRYGFNNNEISGLEQFIDGKKDGKIKNDFGIYRKGKPKTETTIEPTQEGEVETEVSESQEVTYTLPKDPKEIAKDFEVVDNRNQKAGLEINEDGTGKWYIINKKTGNLFPALGKREAVFYSKPENIESWDYGEGEGLTQQALADAKAKIQDTELVIEEGKPLTVNENKQVFRAVRDPKTPKETRRKAFLDIINKIKTKGKVAARAAKSLIKEVEGLNFANPVTVERAIQKITKTFEKANNVEALNTAKKIKQQIKKATSNKNLDANVSAAAKEFLRIDPLMVDDITKYQEEAANLLKGLRSTRRTKTGINVAPAVDIKSTEEYSVKEIEAQDKRQAQLEADAFEALTGVPPGDLSLSEVRDILSNEETTEEAKKNKAEKKSKVIFDALKNAFSVYTAVVDEQLKTQTDPFTGEKIEITADQKRLVRAFMNMDLNVLTDQEALQALDSLINFATNASTGGMQAVVSNYVGRTNLVKAIKDGLKGKPLNLGEIKWAKNIASFDLMLEFIFKGQSKANKILALSGFQDVANGSARAETESNNIATNYSDKFSKTKPNGQAFNTAENNTERGMLAFVRRTLVGTEAEQQQEFVRKKGLILETINTLNNTKDKANKKKADTYQKVYDKLLSDSNNITDVESKVDKTNLDAVEWMTEEWKKQYKDLSDTNLNIYNKKLDQDINYTPDIFSVLKTPETENIDEPMFDTSGRRIYNKETGVLKKSNRPKKLGNERYVNLSFDTGNINTLRKALTDINTAAAIQQLKGFVESKDFDKLIPKKEDRELVKQRIKEYVSKKRGLDYVPEGDKKIMRFINTFGTFGVSRTLGSLGQFPKQLTPIFNTMVNAGGANTYTGVSLFTTNKDVREWLKNSGYDIANRGLQSQTALESIDRKLEESADTNIKKVTQELINIQNQSLKIFLVAPDKLAANTSWLAYYSKEMKKQGIDISDPGFDWENHKVNKKAGDYAQQQVNRQQNTSDRDLQGEMYRSNKVSTQLFIKGFFPFANFLLNQKTRMYSDAKTILSKTATSEDKKVAAKSLGGLGVETLIFNAMGLGLTQLTAALSNALMGEDDEEQDTKDWMNRLTGRGQNIVLDLLSPLPITDEIFLSKLNWIMELMQDSEDPFQFYENRKTLTEDLGLFTIGYEKWKEMTDFSNIAFTGEYNKENSFGGSKTYSLSSDEQQVARNSAALYFLYLIGFLPAEAGSVARYNMKTVKRKASKTSRGKKYY